MHWCRNFSILLILLTSSKTLCILIDLKPDTRNDTNQTDLNQKDFDQASSSRKNLFESESITNDAQESTNFFASDLGPYDSLSDYRGYFNNYPRMPYFPEFEEIFRITKTTTPQPAFEFPDYAGDAFSDEIPESFLNVGKSEASNIPGGRRPLRRPQRPLSSGSKIKVSKQTQSEPKDKPRSAKSKTTNKSRHYPKIFKFNPDRVNLAEFDVKKKVNENYLTLLKGDELDYDKVKRNKFLILHGGIFEIERFKTLR